MGNDMEIAGEIAKRLRSQKVALDLAYNAKPKGFVHHSDVDVVAKLAQISNQIARMGHFGQIEVRGDGSPAPAGTLKDVVNANCLVFIEVAGIDLKGQVTKLQKRIDTADKMAKSIEKKMQVLNYVEKVPAEIREKDLQSFTAAQKEADELRESLKNIEIAMKS